MLELRFRRVPGCNGSDTVHELRRGAIFDAYGCPRFICVHGLRNCHELVRRGELVRWLPGIHSRHVGLVRRRVGRQCAVRRSVYFHAPRDTVCGGEGQLAWFSRRMPSSWVVFSLRVRWERPGRSILGSGRRLWGSCYCVYRDGRQFCGLELRGGDVPTNGQGIKLHGVSSRQCQGRCRSVRLQRVRSGDISVRGRVLELQRLWCGSFPRKYRGNKLHDVWTRLIPVEQRRHRVCAVLGRRPVDIDRGDRIVDLCELSCRPVRSHRRREFLRGVPDGEVRGRLIGGCMHGVLAGGILGSHGCGRVDHMLLLHARLLPGDVGRDQLYWLLGRFIFLVAWN